MPSNSHSIIARLFRWRFTRPASAHPRAYREGPPTGQVPWGCVGPWRDCRGGSRLSDIVGPASPMAHLSRSSDTEGSPSPALDPRKEPRVPYSMLATDDTAHDIALTKVYYGLSSTDRGGWITEEDFKRDSEYAEQREAGSCLDGGYRDAGGVIHGIEIVTGNYSQEEIGSKEEFASSLGGEVQFIHV